MIKLFVGNISPTTSDKDLVDLFSPFSGFISAKITFGLNNENTRSGYVVMTNENEAKKAIAELNNHLLKGNRLRIMKAHPIDQKDDFFMNQNKSRNYYRK